MIDHDISLHSDIPQPQIDRGKSDYAILWNRLRALRRDAHARTFATNRILVPVGADSPLSASVTHYSAVLRDLKTVIGDALEIDGASASTHQALLSGVSRILLGEIVNGANHTQLDFSKPFRCLLHVVSAPGRRTYLLQVHGTSSTGKGARLFMQHDKLIRTGVETALSAVSGPTISGTLDVDENRFLSLYSFLGYYGIKIPVEASHRDIDKTISALMPGETQDLQAVDTFALPFTVPEQPRFVLDTARLKLELAELFNEHGTADYSAITRSIKTVSDHIYQRYRALIKTYEHFGASLQTNEKALLAMLQEAGGISLKLMVVDSDGQDNIYHEQHTANPWKATDLEDYFKQAQEELSSYMINTIRYGENEGAINIESLTVDMIVPNIILLSHNLSDIHIKAFDIRSKEPPFLYVDPLAKNAYAQISEFFNGITHELQNSNWDIADSATLTRAATRLVEHYKEKQDDTAWLRRLKEVTNVYYSVLAENLAAQQRLKVVLQPTQNEFAARAICRYLGLDENGWAAIAQPSADVEINLGIWQNTAAGHRSMLSVVYDEDLRHEISKATVRQLTKMVDDLAVTLALKTGYSGAPAALKGKLNGLFIDRLLFVSNSALPGELTQVREAFTQAVTAYNLKAVDDYRALEAERILLTANDAATRMRRSTLTSDTDKAFHCIELLTPTETALLQTRTMAFATFLQGRANNDDLQDLSSTAGHILQLVHQIGGLIPVVGSFINLAFDSWTGDEEAIALDAIYIFADFVLPEFRAMAPRVLGALMVQGANIWTMVQQTEALKASLNARDHAGVAKNFAFLLMGIHSSLQCGASVIHGFTAAAARRTSEQPHIASLPDEQSAASREEPAPGYTTERPPEHSHGTSAPSVDNAYWSSNDEGLLTPQQSGRKITHIDWNGNAIVEGGARAVALGGNHETLYMLNGQAHRAVAGATGAELRPLHQLDIEAGHWHRKPSVAGGAVEFSRYAHTESFPADFQGRPQRREVPANAVSWYDNCISVFEDLPAEVSVAQGSQSQQDIAIGVIEQKYLTRNNGHFEVLEHLGSTNGTTTFARINGSRLKVSKPLPAIPEYTAQIQARIIAAQGMFVTVDISDTLTGLTGKRRVGGVLATRTNGTQELIIEADRGVHYRGTLAAADTLALAPGETSTGQAAINLDMHKISPAADPKRASPALCRDQANYRNSIAHDDFALELFYGAKAANEAYTRHPQWVEKNLAAVGKIKASLPEPVRSVDNPFYMLDTREELAILFAPRNQAALANTLLGRTIEWGQASSARALALGEKVLKRLRAQQPLLATGETLSSTAAERTRLKQALGQHNLLLAQVQGKDGTTVYFAHSAAEQISITASNQADEIQLSHSGSLIDRIEAHYPDPTTIKNITVLSLDEISETDARRIFLSSQRGYSYASVTSLEPPAAPSGSGKAELQLQIADSQYVERAQEIKVASAVIDLSAVTAEASGPQQGSYISNGRYYLKLDNGRIYRAWWDTNHSVFVLIPPEGKQLANIWAYPWVRRTTGHEFTLINRPGLRGGNWHEQTINTIRTRNYERSTRQNGQLLAAQRRNSAEIQIHRDDLAVADGNSLENGKLNVPDRLFSRKAADPDGYVTLSSKIEVPESCISSTEYLVSRYAGGTSEFDYEGERSGNAVAVVPNVEVVAHRDGQETALNISTTGLDDWVEGKGYSDYFDETGVLPKMGEGIGFIQRHEAPGTLSSDYSFHFMFVAGEVLDESGQVTAVLATDLSEPARKTVKGVSTTALPATRNWNTRLYRSIGDMRGAADPDQNYYPHSQYYSVLVRPVPEASAEPTVE